MWICGLKFVVGVVQMKLPRNQFYIKSSELFESDVYLEEVSDVMCIAQAGNVVFGVRYSPNNSNYQRCLFLFITTHKCVVSVVSIRLHLSVCC